MVRRCSIKFTGKHLSWSIFLSLFLSKVPALRSATLLKQRLWYSCFFVNFSKLLRAPILKNIFEGMPLKKEVSRVTTWSEAFQKLILFVKKVWFCGSTKYLSLKRCGVMGGAMLIFVSCIKLDESKTSDRTFIRGYSENLR